MAVRAVRGAIQVDSDTREDILQCSAELVAAVLERNGLTAEFPAYAARLLGLTDVPLLCASEIAVPGALPRTLRLLAHVDTELTRAQLRHVYLRGAAALRTDLPR